MISVEYLYSCFLAVLSLFGLIGTFVLVVVLVKEKLLNEISYIIMFSLALADFGNLSVMAFHLSPEKLLDDFDWPPWNERMANRATLLFWYTALGHYLIMAANRFTAVRYPFKTNLWFSTNRTITYISIAWICGIFACIVPFFNVCCDQIFSVDEHGNATDYETNYIKGATKIIDTIVIVILIVIYFLTYRGFNKTFPSRNSIDVVQLNEINRRANQSKRISLQFAIISLVFGFVVISMAFSDSDWGGDIFKDIVQLAFCLNAGANVVIYSVFNSSFRKYLIGNLCCKKNEMARVQETNTARILVRSSIHSRV
jgi:hypothetical protein